MRKKVMISVAMILFSLTSAVSQNSLNIIDPMEWWSDFPAFITDADITVHPRGIFAEIGLYLTFSTDTLEEGLPEQLEVIYDFDLPTEAIVTDSWLWIEGQPEKALILDRWTASAIYEGIVERRKDPSILTKISQTHYQLRIYPLGSKTPRKVKINYLVPFSWAGDQATIPLPDNMIRVGWDEEIEFDIYVKADDTWHHPTLVADESKEFEEEVNEDYETDLRATSFENPEQIHYLAYDSPMKDGLFLCQSGSEEGGYYQLAVRPADLLEVEKPRKICFLLDNTSDAENLYDNLESNIRNYMSTSDSFNLIISRLELYRVSEHWLPAHDSTITRVFQDIKEMSNSYSLLPSLIANGIRFIQEHNQEGDLLIISNNASIRTTTNANQLIEDLSEYKPWPVIHVCDLNGYSDGIWMGGRTYFGDEYFYGMLTRQTNGNYVSSRNGKSTSENLKDLILSAGDFIKSFDMYTTLENGFCFSRFNAGLPGATAYLNKPILQVGQYSGSFPFRIIMSGIYVDEAFSEESIIDSEDIHPCDTVAEQIWSGMYVKSLEQSGYSNEVIGEIIRVSLDQRILTSYTAFLTLEPGVEPELPEEEEFWDDDGGGIAISNESEEALDNLHISAYPNPFTSSISFEIEWSEDALDENGIIRIYNTAGQLIKIIDISNLRDGNRLSITWDGKNEKGLEAGKGIYIVKLTSDSISRTFRIIKL